MERGHAVAIGAGRAGDAADAIVEDSEAVSVGSGAAGDAALGVVEAANALGLGGRERGKCGQECDGDDSHGRCDPCPQSGHDVADHAARPRRLPAAGSRAAATACAAADAVRYVFSMFAAAAELLMEIRGRINFPFRCVEASL